MFLKNRHTAVFLLITALMFWANVGITQTKWEKYSGNPVLGLGPNGAWDDYNIWESTVLFDSAKYQMWYNGEGSPDNPRIGYATSADGMVWQKHPANPVLVPGASGAWDDWYVGYSTVLFDGAEYQMWYSGYDGSVRIGYATSIPEPTLTIKTNKEIYNPWERVQALADVGNPGSSFTANLLERSISLTLSEVISTDMGLRT